MEQNWLRMWAYGALVFMSVGYSNVYAGLFDSDNAIHLPDDKKSAAAQTAKYAATIHVGKYIDARNAMAPKKIGISSQRIAGVSSKELLLDKDVTEFVASEMKRRFDDAGFQLIEESNKVALFEITGTVKELTYNAKERDEISIVVETTLTEIATHKVIWSGVVVEKKERAVEVSGNSQKSIANKLRFDLGIVTQKTYDAVSASLMAVRPELFNITPGTKAIAGVTVLQAAGVVAASAPVAQAVQASHGTLVLNVKPTRAKVYLDGVYFGMSPLHAEVEAGVHEVTVKLEGYKNGTEKISVRKGEVTELELALEH